VEFKSLRTLLDTVLSMMPIS